MYPRGNISYHHFSYVPRSFVVRGPALANTAHEKVIQIRLKLESDIGAGFEALLPAIEIRLRHLVIASALDDQHALLQRLGRTYLIVAAQVQPVCRGGSEEHLGR